MIIRKAEETDIPEVVEVLKASLGETDLPLSEEIWRFKHVQNPFGESLVLLAVENEKIIGVRALMRWRWQKKEQVYTAFRAVDTATHPEHQGKGIFKKLTLKAIEVAESEGDHFIFNTPNEKSRPGYLKMGWEAAGKLNVGLLPAYTSFWKHKNTAPYKVSKIVSKEEIQNLCSQWNLKLQSKSGIFTQKSPEYLEWRYEKNPLQNYEVKATRDFYLAVYVKKRKNIKELRLAECIIRNEASISAVKRTINELASRFGVQVISFSPNISNLYSLALKGNYGPILTFRKLNVTPQEVTDFLNVNNWSYSLGDLELF